MSDDRDDAPQSSDDDPQSPDDAPRPPGDAPRSTDAADERASEGGDHGEGAVEPNADPDGGAAEDLTHVEDGAARMVDVGGKPDTARRAVAEGTIHLRPETVAAVRADELEKGDVLATARLGAIDAVKHTWETIPMCHQIPVTNVDVDFEVGDDRIRLRVAVETVGKTGCEMEAIQGVTTGLGVVWDMVKAVEKDAQGQYPETRIADVRVLQKVKRPLE